MWPNEQINGISFCGALMNGEKRAAFFHMAVGGDHARLHAPQTSPLVPRRLGAGAESMLSVSTGEV